MTEHVEADFCVIGGGTGGLVTAVTAARLGLRTVLFERDRMGGDCLNYGCVPSKALLAAAKAAKAVRAAGRLGIAAAPPVVDFAAVMRHVHGAIAAIAPNDSAERLRGFGVRVVLAAARFTGPDAVAGGGLAVRARRIVIAAGSRPAQPPIPGLDRVPFLTNETIFANSELPRHLIVIGGGPVGVELAQAHRLLGAEVTLLEAAHLLPNDDPELVALLRQTLGGDGIAIREGVTVAAVEPAETGVAVVLRQDGREERITGSHLLVATGRRPNVEDLDLDRAGIACGPAGIAVDRRLRTLNRRAFAVGDIVAGGPRFTHVAEYQAGIVIRNAVFRLPARVDYRALPWVTYTDPELAHIGMTEAAARRNLGDGVRVLRLSVADIDRARTDRDTDGLLKVVAQRNGRVLGASLLGAQAGELIQAWGLAIGRGLKLSAVAQTIAPYPTLGEINRRLALGFYAPRLFSVWPRRLARLLALLP